MNETILYEKKNVVDSVQLIKVKDPTFDRYHYIVRTNYVCGTVTEAPYDTERQALVIYKQLVKLFIDPHYRHESNSVKPKLGYSRIGLNNI